MRRWKRFLTSEGVKARFLRGTALTIFGVGGQNALRLASNLVLTRLLFPEAFGLMALVQVFVTGLAMFTDAGIQTSIIRSTRGDEPAFLNTAWTIQILRGVLLWLLCWAVAYPAAELYGEPMLTQLLPIVGLNMLITGFTPTKVHTNARHLMLGRLTVIDLSSQLVGLLVMILLSWLMRSVWALVIGGLLSSAWKLASQYRSLPGPGNRLYWDRSAFGELFHFGKYLFLSTAVTFVINQGDKATLGAFVPLAMLGIYNIGYFMGSVPLIISQAVMNKAVFPLYRLKPIAESKENRAKVLAARRLVIAAALLIAMVMAHIGVALVDFLYDPRYALAGPILVLMSLVLVPRLIFLGYGQALLASGDSRAFFSVNFSTALMQTVLMLLGAIWLGIFGVVIAPGLALLATYPLRFRILRKYNAWDPLADAAFFALGGLVNGSAVWLHWDTIRQLM